MMVVSMQKDPKEAWPNVPMGGFVDGCGSSRVTQFDFLSDG